MLPFPSQGLGLTRRRHVFTGDGCQMAQDASPTGPPRTASFYPGSARGGKNTGLAKPPGAVWRPRLPRILLQCTPTHFLALVKAHLYHHLADTDDPWPSQTLKHLPNHRSAFVNTRILIELTGVGLRACVSNQGRVTSLRRGPHFERQGALRPRICRLCSSPSLPHTC